MIHDIMKANKAVESCINLEKIPGAVMQIGHGDSIDFVQAYGYAEIIPNRRLMTENTLFDLASVTKVTAVWPGIIRLLNERKIKLETTVNCMLNISNLPADIGGITLHQLLTHTAGFVPFMDTVGETREERILSLLTQTLMYKPGTQFVYSDLSFICLGEIIAQYSGVPLHEASKQIFSSLGMRDTGYLPDKSMSF
ncbi:MAG TPA: serine hydrolase domain-containing protein, partial [Desulfuromonadaceae bacterium]